MRVHGNLNQMTGRHRGTLHGASHRPPRSKKKHWYFLKISRL